MIGFCLIFTFKNNAYNFILKLAPKYLWKYNVNIRSRGWNQFMKMLFACSTLQSALN